MSNRRVITCALLKMQAIVKGLHSIKTEAFVRNIFVNITFGSADENVFHKQKAWSMLASLSEDLEKSILSAADRDQLNCEA